MTEARIAEMEAAIKRDEATNPNAFYEYQGTIDESHARRSLAHDAIGTLAELHDTAFLAPDGKWITERRPFNQADFDAFPADPKRQALVKRILSDDDATLPSDGPTVSYGAAGI